MTIIVMIKRITMTMLKNQMLQTFRNPKRPPDEDIFLLASTIRAAAFWSSAIYENSKKNWKVRVKYNQND